MAVALGDLTIEHFEPLVGEGFDVQLGDRVERLILASVDRAAGASGEPRNRVPFSLTLKGATPGLLMHQHIRAIEHPAIGSHELFLTPIATNPDGTHSYEAAFG